jgi:hypothetical protein
VKDKDLTPKQQRWMETSRKIGPGTMTRTERETLEKLYAEMLPAEQQELFDYIKTKFGKGDDTGTESKEDPITVMEKMIWSEPSTGLKNILGKVQIAKGPFGK